MFLNYLGEQFVLKQCVKRDTYRIVHLFSKLLFQLWKHFKEIGFAWFRILRPTRSALWDVVTMPILGDWRRYRNPHEMLEHKLPHNLDPYPEGGISCIRHPYLPPLPIIVEDFGPYRYLSCRAPGPIIQQVWPARQG